MSLLSALVTTALLLVAGQPGPMEFTTIGQGANSRISEPRTVVVRSAADWSALWKQHSGAAKPPAVDFTREMVVAVFSGTRQTAGYSAEITGIAREADAVVVTYREQGPGRDDMVAQMLTTPFHVVRTPSHPGPVKFQPHH